MKAKLSIIISIVFLSLIVFVVYYFSPKVIMQKRYIQSAEIPLQYVVDNLSLEEFEQEVINHPELINYKASYIPKEENMSILSACAICLKTNYVRVLISHGADLSEAIDWNSKYGSENAVMLLREVSEELKKKQ